MSKAISEIELGTSETLTETLARFRQDLGLYAAACLVIRDKNSQLHEMEFWGAQKKVHEIVSKQLKETGRIRVVILKARQEGVSTYTAARFFRRIHLWPGQVGMVMADTLIRASSLFGMYERFHRNLPVEIAPGKRGQQSQAFLSFSHDSEITVRPASDLLAGRGTTIHCLHASEMAFWDAKGRDAWVAVTQAVPQIGSEIIIESTAKGAGGLFHEMWQLSQNPNSGWIGIFLPWWIHEEYEMDPPEELAGHIRQHPDEFEEQALGPGIPYEGELHNLSMRKLCWRRMVITQNFGGDLYDPNKDSVREFMQEYPATAEEAFLVSGACYFDEDELRRMARDPELIKDPDVRGLLDEDADTKHIQVRPNARGTVRLYEKPDERAHYVIGVDTAEGKLVATKRVADASEKRERGDRDYSAAVVLRLARNDEYGNLQPAKIVATIHGWIPPEILAKQLHLLGRMYSCGGVADGTYAANAYMGVERNHGSGQTVLRLLKDHYKYFPMFHQRLINKRTDRVGNTLGWTTTQDTRMLMLDELAAMIRKQELIVPSKEIVGEMMTFVLWEDGKPAAEEGCHDDYVIALAIAVQMGRKHRHATRDSIPGYEIQDEHTG